MPTKINAEAEQARFVFKGTVQKLKGATLREITADQRTAVVRVDEVIHAPEVLSQYAGQDITVITGKKKLRKGQQSVFYTNGVLFGDSVAVEAVDYHDIGKMPAAMAVADADPVRNLARRDLQRRYESADVVLSGRVTAVRIPTDVVAAFASRAADATATGPISEHDPDWRIGEIQVDQVHKGTHKSKTAEVRFPSSTDVMWHEAPKFHTGQEGFFVLHKAAREEKAARSAPSEDPGEYVAFDSADYQAFDEADGIRSLIGS
ncbi:MAG TPA: hypothetical protein VE863_07170 [Pyrinomonadaceae bacterium]|jgi:hypothetical protein|nr:hypothetical protein [Pyrinomonadaceae bacterium]